MSVTSEHFDVLIVGAGVSGIGGAHHLTRHCPGVSFVVLEAQESFGGTWHSHRYPGIRSDSDLYTYGYAFKPWTGAPIATAAEILKYLGEVIDESGLGTHIRYRHRITRASWSSDEKRWTIEATRGGAGETVRLTAGFIWMCQGYYRHSDGFTPEWPGMRDFEGIAVHPMQWPDDLDYGDKAVVVIGSGATAATVVPAMADTAGHVTMLQRSPTYYFAERNAIAIADELRDLGVEEGWIHEIVRRRILRDQDIFQKRTFSEPEVVSEELISVARKYLGPEFDLERHFTPRYRPWQQRIARIPDADLYKAIAAGKASVVTDEIDHFDRTGIVLKSGSHLDADIIVTATGFHLSALGDISFEIDGNPLVFGDTVTYRGMMFAGVPNMAWVFGYFRAAWTLRSDLVADFVCRLLNHMREQEVRMVTPMLRHEDADMQLLPWIDEQNFNPGYLKRGLHLFPRRGNKPEWAHSQDHWADQREFPSIDLNDPVFRYG